MTNNGNGHHEEDTRLTWEEAQAQIRQKQEQINLLRGEIRKLRPTVYWAPLMERSVQGDAVLSLLGAAQHCGYAGYELMQSPYQRTDSARNKIVEMFLRATYNEETGETEDDAVLVMLDNDHLLMPNIITRLTRFPPHVGVVGALAFRRGGKFDPCFFVRSEDGKQLLQIAPEAYQQQQLIRGAIVGTGCIAIRRWVFMALMEHRSEQHPNGIQPPFFRYGYQDGASDYPTEDVYFGLMCEHAGIPHFLDTTTEIPHLITGTVDHTSFEQYLAEHPDEIKPMDMRVQGEWTPEDEALLSHVPEMQTRVMD